ncbi:MAG: hypothetical protein M1308_18400 [Actinobacteria bacterium]|nr:hypothetical protein [Actinomycetota bacterium]
MIIILSLLPLFNNTDYILWLSIDFSLKVNNIFNNLAKGKDLEEPIVFQGGVAANVGIIAAFEKTLGKKVIIPQHHDVMGAYGAALIAKEKMSKSHQTTKFYGFEIVENDYKAKSTECNSCSNMCEVIE